MRGQDDIILPFHFLGEFVWGNETRKKEIARYDLLSGPKNFFRRERRVKSLIIMTDLAHYGYLIRTPRINLLILLQM